MKDVLIAKKKEADEVTRVFYPKSTICVDGDLGDDEVTFKLVGINDEDETEAFDSAGNALVLSAARTTVCVASPVHLKVSKTVTSNPVGIYVFGPVT